MIKIIVIALFWTFTFLPIIDIIRVNIINKIKKENEK